MRAVHVGTRLAGTDGVSLEATKVANVLAKWGFERIDVAGEVETAHAVHVPEMHFRHPTTVALQRRAFGASHGDALLAADLAAELAADLAADLDAAAGALAKTLDRVLRRLAPDLVVVQNAWAIPMHLPLAKALAEVIDATGVPTLSHEHDYPWERERFAVNAVPDWIDAYFPWDGPMVRHLAINTPAAISLAEHRGLTATVVPNVMDFSADAPDAVDAERVRAEVRAALGLASDQRLVLQPTRVIPRKGIHLAIDLLAQLDDPRNVLVISHASGDEGDATLAQLQADAARRGVDLRYVPSLFTPERTATTWSLSDAYVAADFVTYPSLYEGFGNALLETIAHRRAALVNRYPVYVSDIAPTGVSFVEIEGAVTPEAVEAVRVLLDRPEERERIAARNHDLAAAAFGLPALANALLGPLSSLGLAP